MKLRFIKVHPMTQDLICRTGNQKSGQGDGSQSRVSLRACQGECEAKLGIEKNVGVRDADSGSQERRSGRLSERSPACSLRLDFATPRGISSGLERTTRAWQASVPQGHRFWLDPAGQGGINHPQMF